MIIEVSSNGYAIKRNRILIPAQNFMLMLVQLGNSIIIKHSYQLDLLKVSLILKLVK